MQHESTAPLRLGHIVYSNCFPVHARLVDQPRTGDPILAHGVPTLLNQLLDRGEIDVAPSSSIEYARHPESYRILPDLVIGAHGPVRSILLLSPRHPRELDDLVVALPTASATSVVLLKILLRRRWKAEPRFVWFDQAGEDPFAAGATAALFIGDVALRPGLHPDLSIRLDLGSEWLAETGLPFAFAVWQAGSGDERALCALHARLVESTEFFDANRVALAGRHAARFGLSPELLGSYWSDLQFRLDERMVQGLEAFYELAAEIGELPRAPALRWVG
jgi:chorismate dehydratase